MARKRLLTILAAAVAAIGLQVGSATALDVDADLGVATVGVSVSEEGIEAKVGDEDEDDKLGAKVSKDGADLKVGDKEVSTGDKVEDIKEQVDEGGADDSSKESKEPKESSPKESNSGDGATGDTREVTTAAGARETEPVEDDHQRPDALDPEQARQFLPGSEDRPDRSASRDDITPSFDLSGGEDLDEPVIAAPSERQDGSDAADWEPVEPPVTERSDAELAAIPAPEDGSAVPAGLKLLAGLLVAGTGTLWHVTRRELGTPNTVRVG